MKTYSTPDLIVYGDATALIQGSTGTGVDATGHMLKIAPINLSTIKV